MKVYLELTDGKVHQCVICRAMVNKMVHLYFIWITNGRSKYIGVKKGSDWRFSFY